MSDLHFDIIIPVPTHDNEIGPSMAISRRLSDETGIPTIDILQFTEGMKNSKDLSGDEKFDNARDKVFLNDVHKIGSMSVLLVDDIITTCGTAHWCSMELIKKGATSVHVLGALRNVRKTHLDFIGYSGRY
jgi:predicted amidophosphoribosyltransferase